MFKKGLLCVFTAFIFIGSPVLSAAESAATVDKVVTWWEQYGKYWDDAVADSGSDDKLSVASND